MKDAHETICHDAGLSTHRHNIPSVSKPNGKTGSGELLIKDAKIGDNRHLIIDVACTHELCGNHLLDVGLNPVWPLVEQNWAGAREGMRALRSETGSREQTRQARSRIDGAYSECVL